MLAMTGSILTLVSTWKSHKQIPDANLSHNAEEMMQQKWKAVYVWSHLSFKSFFFEMDIHFYSHSKIIKYYSCKPHQIGKSQIPDN